MTRPSKRCLVLLLCLFGGFASGATPLELQEGTLRIDLKPYLELLEDAEADLDLSEAKRAEGFASAIGQGTNFGFTRSAWWVRFTLVNPGDRDLHLVLRQDYPLIDWLDLWAEDLRGQWRHTASGDRRPFDSREYRHRDFLFGLDVPARSTRSVYLRYQTDGSMDIALHLYSDDALVAAVSEEQVALGMYYGGFAVLIIYNFFIFLAVRDRVFFWYLLYAISFGLHFAVHNGLSFQFLWPNQPAWANQSLVVLLSLSLIFALQFTRGFLNAARNSPKLDKAALVLQGLAALLLVLSFVLPYAKVVVPIAQLTVLVTLLILVLGSLSLLKGYRPARYFMLAWGLMLLGVLAYLLKAFGILPHTLLTQHGFQVGSLLEMTLLAVALSARVRDLQKYSFSDPLTNLLNRRSFDQHLDLEFVRAARNGAPVSLLIVDIDHFKRLNDRLGHAKGDAALQLVARELRANMRQGDVLCRYGGEEFAVILPGADCDAATTMAEKLRQTLADVRFEGEPITISVGVACSIDRPFADSPDLFHAADEALYAAKKQGRNRVVRNADGAELTQHG